MTNSSAATPSSFDFSPRTRRWGRIAILIFCGLLMLTVVSAGLFVFWLRVATRAALPQLDGEVHLSGLSAPVTVRRDTHGTPHIEAANEADLFVAQGYVTAQDRLWQMDTLRRSANGELAEIAGPAALDHDRMQRVLQIRRTAERIYANLSAADRTRLDQYARGVNLFIEQHPLTLPPEFRLLRYQPKSWTGVDTISVGLSMVQGLDSHFEAKLSRAHIAAKLQNERLEADLYPVGSWRDHPPTGIQLDLSQPHPEPPSPPSSDDDDDDRSQAMAAPIRHRTPALRRSSAAGVKDEGNLRAPSLRRSSAARVGSPIADLEKFTGPGEDPARLRELQGLPACDGCALGSNNWVVDGRHTASGKPLLSNDMHLALMTPNIWHMVELSAPGYHVAGVTMPGVPGVIAGHNDHIAWGITALYADTQDLFVEKLDGKGNFQDLDTQWKPLQIDHEVIHVRGHKDVEVPVQLTDHGPLLNPIFTKETQSISLKWTIYDPKLNALPIYEVNKASNWTEFSAAWGAWLYPTLSIVYSDDQGHIGYHAVGRVPIRGGGVGLLDVPLSYGAKDPRALWGYQSCAGICPTYIPFDQMPGVFDPPAGLLATANSRVTTESSPYLLTNNWIEPYRTERIYKQLQGRDHLTSADMLALQTDIYSETDQELGQRLAYAIDHADSADARLHQAADLMRSWDGRLSTDSPAASIVTQTRGTLWSLLLEPRLGKDLAGSYNWASKNFAQEEIVMHAKPEWLPPGYKNWDELLTAAVRKAFDENKAPANLARWTYGSWHVIELDHPIASKLPFLGRMANTGPLPLSGDGTTVKQVGRGFGPSQRFTMDWSNIDGSSEDIVLGESGNPLSPYYRDQWNAYYNGTTFALPFTPAAVAAQSQHTLRLLP